jgi:hypothetical protein
VIRCWLFGHKLKRVRPLLIGGELVLCHRCGIQLCVHHGRQQVIPYDAEIQRFEEDIRNLIEKYAEEPKP